MLPIASSYPPGQTNPVLARVLAVLPAAGAWDAAPVEFLADGFSHIALFIQYERGAAGGAVDIRIEVSPFSQDQLVYSDWFQTAIYDAGAVAAGGDTDSLVQREYLTYTVTGAGVEGFTYGPIPISGNIERIRISARESGVVITPGECGIIATVFER